MAYDFVKRFIITICFMLITAYVTNKYYVKKKTLLLKTKRRKFAEIFVHVEPTYYIIEYEIYEVKFLRRTAFDGTKPVNK